MTIIAIEFRKCYSDLIHLLDFHGIYLHSHCRSTTLCVIIGEGPGRESRRERERKAEAYTTHLPSSSLRPQSTHTHTSVLSRSTSLSSSLRRFSALSKINTSQRGLKTCVNMVLHCLFVHITLRALAPRTLLPPASTPPSLPLPHGPLPRAAATSQTPRPDSRDVAFAYIPPRRPNNVRQGCVHISSRVAHSPLPCACIN